MGRISSRAQKLLFGYYASILSGRRVVFNIKGNDFQPIAALAYNTGVVFVKFVGGHAEYDRIDAETVERKE